MMDQIRNFIRGFVDDESGQGTVEWVLITALVVVFVMVLIIVFRDQIGGLWDSVTGWMDDSTSNINY